MRRIILALGGNALGDNPKEQEGLTRDTARVIVDLVEKGNQVIVTHGNGPQVGMINLALEEDEIPLPECIAMSQGYIGYHLEKAIREELELRNIGRNVSSLLTQVLVDENDKAFAHPSKPIGRFYTEEEALCLGGKFLMKNDSGRGFRRYVASPRPVDILEADLIEALVEGGSIVIAGGGGGIPVIKRGKRYIGVDGVIDKDFTSEVLADKLGADYFIILTQVDQVYLNFGQEDQKSLARVGVEALKEHMAKKEFGEGSMLPKIEASISFVESAEDRKAIITSIDQVEEALEGRAGTLIN